MLFTLDCICMDMGHCTYTDKANYTQSRFAGIEITVLMAVLLILVIVRTCIFLSRYCHPLSLHRAEVVVNISRYAIHK